MDKKKLNWDVPREVAEHFDRLVTDRWGGKGKWIGAVTAILLYLDAPDEVREKLGAYAAGMTGGRVPEGLAKILKERQLHPNELKQELGIAEYLDLLSLKPGQKVEPFSRVAARPSAGQKSTPSKMGTDKRSKPGTD